MSDSNQFLKEYTDECPICLGKGEFQIDCMHKDCGEPYYHKHTLDCYNCRATGRIPTKECLEVIDFLKGWSK